MELKSDNAFKSAMGMSKIIVSKTIHILKIVAFAFSFTMLLILLGQFESNSFESEEEEITVKRGKIVFEKAGCFVCHGNEGSGGVRNKNSATGEQIPSLTYISRGYDNQSLRERVRRGSVQVKKRDINGPTPPVSMPSFRTIISEEEITDLIAYLRSLTPEEDEEPRIVSKDRPPVPDYMLPKDACHICHGIMAEKFKANSHFSADTANKYEPKGTVCVNCHGDGTNHAKKYGEPNEILLFIKESQATTERKNRACLSCHERGLITHWVGSLHETKFLACVDCHKVMEPASNQKLLIKSTEIEVCTQCHQQQRTQLMRPYRMPMREGKVTCSDCHNSHGTTTEGMLSEPSVNENCYRCHAEKRGPFLWEHPPVAENCLNCHQPHGSTHEKLLTISPPRLCQQCHIGSEVHNTTPQLARSRFVFNRSCVNCHIQIHGSNHPSGVRFHR